MSGCCISIIQQINLLSSPMASQNTKSTKPHALRSRLFCLQCRTLCKYLTTRTLKEQRGYLTDRSRGSSSNKQVLSSSQASSSYIHVIILAAAIVAIILLLPIIVVMIVIIIIVAVGFDPSINWLFRIMMGSNKPTGERVSSKPALYQPQSPVKEP